MINNTTLVGRLTKKPELQKTSSGVSYCKFSIAVTKTLRKCKWRKRSRLPFVYCVEDKSRESMQVYGQRFINRSNRFNPDRELSTY